MDIDKILLIPLLLSILLIGAILYWLLVLISFGMGSRRLQASTSIDVNCENWREEKTGIWLVCISAINMGLIDRFSPHLPTLTPRSSLLKMVAVKPVFHARHNKLNSLITQRMKIKVFSPSNLAILGYEEETNDKEFPELLFCVFFLQMLDHAWCLLRRRRGWE